MVKVRAHQRPDLGVRFLTRGAKSRGDGFLQLVREHIEVAPSLQVKNRANTQHEVFGLVEASGSKFERLRLSVECRDETDGGDVTQSARRVFDVRFELIQRVLELRMSVAVSPSSRTWCPISRRRSHSG